MSTAKHNIHTVIRQAFGGSTEFEYVAVGIARKPQPNGTVATVFFGADDERGVIPIGTDGVRWCLSTIAQALMTVSAFEVEPERVPYHDPDEGDSPIVTTRNGGYDA